MISLLTQLALAAGLSALAYCFARRIWRLRGTGLVRRAFDDLVLALIPDPPTDLARFQRSLRRGVTHALKSSTDAGTTPLRIQVRVSPADRSRIKGLEELLEAELAAELDSAIGESADRFSIEWISDSTVRTSRPLAHVLATSPESALSRAWART
jgi:hypothetical protein